MAEISLRGMSKRYPNGFVAVRDVTLDVADGEFLVLVGPSGCGKSTLLRMIAGLEEISAGTLHVGGKDVTEAPPRDRDIAMVFQSYALYPHMTVAKNIGYPLRLAGLAADDIDRRVRSAASMLQLDAVLDRKPGQLSGGQRQRVAMGRAIVRKPAAFLMDEPLSNLDAKLRVQMRAEIAKLQREFGTTTVYVTHDQIEAMTMGDRVAVLNAGRIAQCDTPRRLYDRPDDLFVAAFIGSPSMNFVAAELIADDRGLVARSGELELPLPADEWAHLAGDVGREVTIGLRPEAIGLQPAVDGAPALDASVDFVEELGAELLVHASVSVAAPSDTVTAAVVAASDERDVVHVGSDLVARVPPRAEARPGSRLRLHVDPHQVHVFDPAGPSLRREGRP